MDGWDDNFGAFDDTFESPVFEHAMEPTTPVKKAKSTTINLSKMDTDTIKGFIKDNPNSYVLVSCRSKGLLRLDTKRTTKYEVMLIPSLRDTLEDKNKNHF